MPDIQPPQAPTERQIQIMRQIKAGCVTAGFLANRLAPKGVGPIPFGRRAGRWQAMGAELSRMKKIGLVNYELSTTGQKEWFVTAAGAKLTPTDSVA